MPFLPADEIPKGFHRLEAKVAKWGICIKIEFNPQKNISLLQYGRRFFVYSYNMVAVTSCEHTQFETWDKYLNGNISVERLIKTASHLVASQI